MKATHLLKYGAIFLSTLAVIAKPVSAQEDLYGETGERWAKGAALEQKGDFDSAIIQYKQALQAIKNIENQHLRDCANEGTVARLEGAKVGKQYIHTHGNSSHSVSAAIEASQKQFRQVIDEIDAKRPDLASSCP